MIPLKKETKQAACQSAVRIPLDTLMFCVTLELMRPHDTQRWYILDGSRREGPYTLAEIQDLLKQGKIEPKFRVVSASNDIEGELTVTSLLDTQDPAASLLQTIQVTRARKAAFRQQMLASSVKDTPISVPQASSPRGVSALWAGLKARRAFIRQVIWGLLCIAFLAFGGYLAYEKTSSLLQNLDSAPSSPQSANPPSPPHHLSGTSSSFGNTGGSPGGFSGGVQVKYQGGGKKYSIPASPPQEPPSNARDERDRDERYSNDTDREVNSERNDNPTYREELDDRDNSTNESYPPETAPNNYPNNYPNNPNSNPNGGSGYPTHPDYNGEGYPPSQTPD